MLQMQKASHVMVNCLVMKNRFDRTKKKKAICVTWDELNASESEEESNGEEVFLCHIAFEDSPHGDKDSIEELILTHPMMNQLMLSYTYMMI